MIMFSHSNLFTISFPRSSQLYEILISNWYSYVYEYHPSISSISPSTIFYRGDNRDESFARADLIPLVYPKSKSRQITKNVPRNIRFDRGITLTYRKVYWVFPLTILRDNLLANIVTSKQQQLGTPWIKKCLANITSSLDAQIIYVLIWVTKFIFFCFRQKKDLLNEVKRFCW